MFCFDIFLTNQLDFTKTVIPFALMASEWIVIGSEPIRARGIIVKDTSSEVTLYKKAWIWICGISTFKLQRNLYAVTDITYVTSYGTKKKDTYTNSNKEKWNLISL